MGGKRRVDGEGALYPMHAHGCPKPEDRHGNPACKCKWRGAYIVGWRDDKPIRKTVSGANRSATQARLNELKDRHSANTLPVGKVPTVEQWLNHCHAKLLRRGKRPLKESSLVNYRGVFDNYLIPLLGHLRLDRLTAERIEDAWDTLAEDGNPLGEKARPLAPATIHHAHVVLVRCLRLAVQRKQITTNPAGPDSMDAPSKGKGEVQPLATEDWRKVLETAQGLPNTARWSVALAIGLRQGEALGLRWSDVDLEKGTLSVNQTLYRLPGKGIVFGLPKTDRAKRTIGLPEELVAEIRRHRKEQTQARLHAGDQWVDSGLVFTLPDGRPLDPSVDRRRWKALLSKAGVEPIKLHAARHTAATMMLLEGIDRRVVMDIMGWSQIATAENYQHAVIEAQRDAVARIGAVVWGQS